MAWQKLFHAVHMFLWTLGNANYVQCENIYVHSNYLRGSCPKYKGELFQVHLYPG